MHYDPEWLIEEHRDRHAIAALFAAIVSIGLHVGAFYWLGEREVQWSSVVPEQMQARRHPSMRVDSVRGTFPDVSSVLPNAANGNGARMVTTPEDLAHNATELGLTPDAVAIEPSAVSAEVLTGDHVNLVEPAEFPDGGSWEPRQEIVAIERRIAADDVAALARRVIPRVDRVRSAPDTSMAPDIDALSSTALRSPDVTTIAPPEATVAAQIPVREQPEPTDLGTDPVVRVGEPAGEGGAELFEETVAEVTDVKPIERLLKARATVYTSIFDLKYGYFKIEVDRLSEDVLPPLPKDILLVQDSSSSMTEQRLYFCRKGLVRCLEHIGSRDRFNLVSFQDRAKFCFETWQSRTDETIAAARQFAEGLTAGGNTDILGSLSPLLEQSRVPGRPVIAFVITDGRSTTGLTSSTDIIGSFTKMNDAAISVYTLGTEASANAYLLDLISYCNRGETRVVTQGRWDIPDVMEAIMREISRPVLSDVRFRLAEPDVFEVYPVLTSNLYLDRPLVLYGRFPRNHPELVFQAVGSAGETRCDMIFDLNLRTESDDGERDIRAMWAQQKIYHLIGENARRPSLQLIDELRRTAKAYKVDIPHADSLGL